jgi:hypothetical protein
MKVNRSALLISISVAVYVLSLCWFAYIYRNGLMDRVLFFNSDSLFFPSLFKNIFSEGKHFSDWLLPPSSFLFPDALLYAFAYILSKQILTQILIFAILQSLLFFVLSGALLNIFLSRSEAIIYSALISSNIIVIGSYSTDPYALSFISVFHFGSLLSFLLLSVLWLKFLTAKSSNEKVHIGIISFLLAACSIISDRLILLHFAAPILLIGIFIYFTGSKQKEILKFGFLLMAGFLFAFALQKILLPGMGRLDYEIGFGSIANKSMILVNWAIDKPLLIQLYLLSLPITVIAALIFLKNNRSNSDPRFVQKSLFIILFLISTTLALLVTGFSSREFAIRYLLPYLFLPPLFLFILLDIKNRIILASVIFCYSIIAAFAAHDKEKTAFTLYPEVVRCVDALAQKHEVTRGIAQYWDAIPIYVFSTIGLNVVPVLNDGSPMMWLYNSSEFAGRFSFAIIDNSSSGFYQISRKAIEQQLARKPFEYQCFDKTILIFDNETISLQQQSEVSNMRSSALESFVENPRALLIMAREESEKGNPQASLRILSEAIALLKRSGARDETVNYYESVMRNIKDGIH